jgi:hypothetical protein
MAHSNFLTQFRRNLKELKSLVSMRLDMAKGREVIPISDHLTRS